jgi:hypothetical protein
MSDSFFGFDTTLPPLDSDQLNGLGENIGGQKDEIEEEELERKFRNFSLDSGEDFGVYDDEQNLYLGAQLEETGDDFNDETFGNVGEIGTFIFLVLCFPPSFLDRFASGFGSFSYNFNFENSKAF